jgi:protein SCO1/2
MKRGFPLSLAVAGVLLLAVVVSFAWQRYAAINTGQSTSTGVAAIGGPFTLTDQTGRAVTDQTYKGKWLLIFFGFTYCPDVCPTTLNRVAQVMDRLGPLASQVQPLFITIDPARDTPAVLAQYTAAFDPRIVGLTGTPDEIAAAAKAYRVYYAKVDQGSDYTMDHSAILYVMRPDGRYEAFFAADAKADDMTAKLKSWIEQG